jgi:hypothetical protein
MKEDADEKPWLRAGLILVLLSACGGREKQVVEQYFNAVRAKDNQTISSFAAVSFDKPVTAWKISATSPETKSPVVLPDLAKKLADQEKQLARQQEGRPALEQRPLRRPGQGEGAAQEERRHPGQSQQRGHRLGQLQQEGPGAEAADRRIQGCGGEGEAQRQAVGG